MPMQSGSRKHQSGFTLIELMVTVAIVSVLATIAVTSYSSQVLKSRRTEAKSALLDLAGREERLFSTTNAYTNFAASLGYPAATATTPMTNLAFGNGYYQLTVTTPTASSYVLQAIPTGSQAGDAACGTFSLNQLGQQTVSGTTSAATCWGN